SEQKTSGAMNGRWIFFVAGCEARTAFRRLHFLSVRMSGLSYVYCRPSVVHVQVPASPVSPPGRLLISTRNMPFGDATRRSTSFRLPSRPMKVKFDHAR